MDIEAPINKGEGVVLTMGHMHYTDEAGVHKKEVCRWFQPPFNPTNPVLHSCSIGHNSEVY